MNDDDAMEQAWRDWADALPDGSRPGPSAGFEAGWRAYEQWRMTMQLTNPQAEPFHIFAVQIGDRRIVVDPPIAVEENMTTEVHWIEGPRFAATVTQA